MSKCQKGEESGYARLDIIYARYGSSQGQARPLIAKFNCIPIEPRDAKIAASGTVVTTPFDSVDLG